MGLTSEDLINVIIAFILPPVAVAIQRGCTGTVFLNIFLTLLFYWPGLIHAIYIIVSDREKEDAANPPYLIQPTQMYQTQAPGMYQTAAPGVYQTQAPGMYQAPAPGTYQAPAPAMYQTPGAEMQQPPYSNAQTGYVAPIVNQQNDQPPYYLDNKQAKIA